MTTNLKLNEKTLNAVNLIPIELKGYRSENEAYQQAVLSLKQNRRFFSSSNSALINAHKYLRKITTAEPERFSETKEQQFLVTESYGEAHILGLSFQAYTAGWFRAWIVVNDASGDFFNEITDLLVPYQHAPKGFVEFVLNEDLLNNLNPISNEDSCVKVSLRLQGKVKLTSKINTIVVSR